MQLNCHQVYATLSFTFLGMPANFISPAWLLFVGTQLYSRSHYTYYIHVEFRAFTVIETLQEASRGNETAHVHKILLSLSIPGLDVLQSESVLLILQPQGHKLSQSLSYLKFRYTHPVCGNTDLYKHDLGFHVE